MDNVSFQSRIKLTSMNAFDKEVRYGKRNYVNYPWTVKQSVISDKAATTDIYDCTAAGFTDGLKVMLLHICPSMAENSNFKKIEKFITSKLDIDSPYLQGFILGSKNFNPNSPNSPKVFDFFLNFMDKRFIPFSFFRGGDYANNIAYSSLTDEWIIGSELLNTVSKDVFKTPKNAVEKIFEEVKISNCDELIW